MKSFSPEAEREVQELLNEYPNPRSALLMVLRVAEREYGCITDEAMELVASRCGVSPAHVLGMVTFYTHFKRPWHGKHRLMVCGTLMCDLGGAKDAIQEIAAVLGIRPGERTADGLFSLEKVECLADCDRPVALQIDDRHLSRQNGETLRRTLAEYLAREGKTAEDYRGQRGVKMNPEVPYIPVKRGV